ncbi:hypothetical protein [Paenibacillus xylanexedens]|nr:hypothetical protein [Paenibacillus xylanexedens]
MYNKELEIIARRRDWDAYLLLKVEISDSEKALLHKSAEKLKGLVQSIEV